MSAVCVCGTVCSPARASRSRLGVWVLRFDVALPATANDKPGTVGVRKDFGTGEAAAVACQTRARQLRPGVRVSVQAPGGSGRIVLNGVTDLLLPDLFDHHQRVAP